MKIAMVGSGYVGLVTGACLAELGHEVVCVDRDGEKIARLQRGEIPIFEPGLGELVQKNEAAGRLTFTTALPAALEDARAVFIAVGTPSRNGDGHADMSFVHAVAREIGAHVQTDLVVVTKSTVPVGTGDHVARLVEEGGTNHRVSVVSNPEFLREGAAIGDFMNPDRVVIGAEDDFGREVMREIYAPLAEAGKPLLFVSRRSSEMVKYAANAFLATKIGFINEMADLCERVGADIQDVSRGIGMDERIGSRFLQAGPGYGGSCFPKDTLALLKTAEDNDSPARIVEAVVRANDARKRAMGRKVIEALGGPEFARGKTVALLGLTFKPDTDDMRDSPAIAIAQTLHDAGVAVRGFDPEGMEQAAPLLPYVDMCADGYAAMDGADAAVVVTEWSVFRALDLDRAKALLTTPVLVDLRNIFDPAALRAAGWQYQSIGRA
ncbi:UDP-glucose/GDP-mannose dehydrogenase family protein [Erythrobacteraceae bacterium CFH 75059]|uniref:UDP-glucose dehydrogenase family protein n=1 Tax=Qipengyuania thermophila TaxID=2509361 RepID=UPI00101F403E|nr:UDP-glucose/GDP-mannose dehydrogenase family protein [Qipengyuania thermophila]TCD02039.1 UDP-glucose/GDP-mannose dehydrogenase family protein [Erythrobacteraceae bacterium CFH 75059]